MRALVWAAARVHAWVGGKGGAGDVIGWMCKGEDVARAAFRAPGSLLQMVRAAPDRWR